MLMAERIDVFISSTSRDLSEYRQAVAKTLLRLGMYPIDMADFNASERNALQLCYDKVQEAEIFIGIYAHRYGYAPTPEVHYTTLAGETCSGDGQTSITHWEYLWAHQRGIPMLLFMVDEEAPWSPQYIDQEPAKTQLRAFKAKLGAQHVWNHFSTPDQLAALVATSLAEIKLKQAETSSQLSPAPRHDFYKHIALPPNYVARQDILKELKAILLHPSSTAQAKQAVSTALHGMGGIGKSVIARALCDEPSIQAAFPDGILWTTLGQSPDLSTKLSEWLQALGGHVAESAPSLDSLKAKLAELLSQRTCLLVVDDVWHTKHADEFRVGSIHSHLLITTRDAEVARNLGARILPIPSMSADEAHALLVHWSNGTLSHSADSLTAKIANRLGRLPLALKLAGAQLQRKDPRTWLERFDARKLEARRADLEDPHSSLERCFSISLSELNDSERSLYAALAIFKEDEVIHESAIQHLWRSLADWEASDVEDFLYDLSARALIELTGTQFPHGIILHDLLRDFISAELQNPQAVHQALLQAYRPDASIAWHQLADDGYLYEHLVYHLQALGAREEIDALFTHDAWFHARVVQRGYLYDGIIADVMQAWRNAHTQALQQIAHRQTPHALVMCIRYALIRTSLNSIAGNYEASLVVTALRLGLSGWTSQRALSIASKITHLERRIAMSAALIASQLLTPNETADAKRIALEALSVISDAGSWAKTSALILPYLSPDEAHALWQDPRTSAFTLGTLATLLTLMPPTLSAELVDVSLKAIFQPALMPHTTLMIASANQYRPSGTKELSEWLTHLPPYLNLEQQSLILHHLHELGSEYHQALHLADLWDTLSPELRHSAQVQVQQWRNAHIRQQTLTWIAQGQAPQRTPLPISVSTALSASEVTQALQEALTIEDERLIERALYNLTHPHHQWKPLMPFNGETGLSLAQQLERFSELNEEQQAKLIVEVAAQCDTTQSQFLLQQALNMRDEWYRALALAAFVPFSARLTQSAEDLIEEIQRCLVLFMLRRAGRQREYLLHFLATSNLFTPPILPHGLAEAIVKQIQEISQQWHWNA